MKKDQKAPQISTQHSKAEQELKTRLIFYFTDEMAVQIPSFDELLKQTVESFEEIYKSKPMIAACAPGRVNLIGEHIDYCDGFVLPMAS